MNFASDTSAPAHPDVIDAVVQANTGSAPSYGTDHITAQAETLLADVFETDVSVYFTSSGTAANALLLSVMCSPTGSILCHEESHISRDERGAPEFFTGGAKLQLLGGKHGLIELDTLEAALAARDPEFVHETPAEVLSITNLTECGTTYSRQQIEDLCEAAHRHGLLTHMDGARLANAIVHTGMSAAEMTWRSGVDAVTFGSTKNGTIGCEAIVLFGSMRDRMGALKARAKRAGHMPPKMRFMSSQMVAYLDNGLWLELAERANRAALLLAEGLAENGQAKLAHPVQGNEVFATLSADTAETLRSAGAAFYPWLDGSYRFVCSWNTDEAEIRDLVRIVSANV